MVDHLKCSSNVTFISFRLKKPNLTNEDEIKWPKRNFYYLGDQNETWKLINDPIKPRKKMFCFKYVGT